MDRTELSVGDRTRSRAGIAVLGSLAVVAVYATFTISTKETPALYLHEPWQDDPYDALVSFDFVALPLLVVIGLLRLQLCHKYEPLPVRRILDLINVCAVAAGLSLATQLSEWVPVATGAHRHASNAATLWQEAALATLTAATVGFAVLLIRARRELVTKSCATGQPDWLADAVALGVQEARRLGPFRSRAQSAVRWVDEQVISRTRRHPIMAAVTFAVVLTLPEVAAKVVLERYPAPLVLLVFGVSTASLFAFLVIVGALLRVVAPVRERPSVWVCAAVAACAAGALALAFRDSLYWTIGASPAHETIASLAGLMLAAALVAGGLSLAGQTVVRRLRHG